MPPPDLLCTPHPHPHHVVIWCVVGEGGDRGLVIASLSPSSDSSLAPFPSPPPFLIFPSSFPILSFPSFGFFRVFISPLHSLSFPFPPKLLSFLVSHSFHYNSFLFHSPLFPSYSLFISFPFSYHFVPSASTLSLFTTSSLR